MPERPLVEIKFLALNAPEGMTRGRELKSNKSPNRQNCIRFGCKKASEDRGA